METETQTAAEGMDLWQAAVLGVVEGITEYLPVSSTGHLLVTQRILGIPESEAANAYAVAIQAGAILAVLGLYRHRVQGMLRGVAGGDPAGFTLARALVVAFLPAAVIGFALDDLIEGWLFGTWPVVAAWAAGGFALFGIERWRRREGGLGLESLTARQALPIGLNQGVAMWPGVSRSLSTIVGGLLVGLSLPAAVEFSFLLGFVTLSAASLYKAIDSGAVMWEAYGPAALAVGLVTSWIAAVLAIKGMVAWLQSRGLGLFAWWRLLAALIVGLAAASGLL
jgi:undecaprenyl-diphosphatase